MYILFLNQYFKFLKYYILLIWKQHLKLIEIDNLIENVNDQTSSSNSQL